MTKPVTELEIRLRRILCDALWDQADGLNITHGDEVGGFVVDGWLDVCALAKAVADDFEARMETVGVPHDLHIKLHTKAEGSKG